MAFFKVKVDGRIYELDRLTLGDARILKRDFGLTDLEFFSTTDPDHMVGLLALSISKTDGISIAAATAEAEGIDLEAFEPQEVEESKPDPTQDDGSEETDVPAKSGKSGKPRKTPGTQG